jgi:hypothetical protein
MEFTNEKGTFLSFRYWVTNEKNTNDQEPGLIITGNVIENVRLTRM